MTKRMLIDATHSEEMRVVIVDGTRLDELDIETSTKKQLKGNIYLAKVARVEPSLQAAFVDYGGNRHGFLAFNEIHPDYYQIPVADREALKAALLEEASASDDDDDDRPSPKHKKEHAKAKEQKEEVQVSEKSEENENSDSEVDEEHVVETITENEHDEVLDRNRFQQTKKYKIQEVIHRGQVLLIQVTKEERGNKGAALTTYLSLAGRYCVLMPNNARGGGVSRKITNATDRKRLKQVVSKLPLPTGMSVIVRTAGKERTAMEIKRDYEYLIKTWVQIRDKTMTSSAPALIYEEGNLIKRALRDMYTRDIEEILIEGETEYKMARDFMKMLTPSHAKKVKLYKDPEMPLFFRYQVEAQLEAMHSNIIQLKSGAYLVMDQTEALVAIDVNSGRATKEKNIEETALKTNLEAADEIARQLRLRDLAGLIVIDFIDMEEARNNHAVERRMKDALRRDRARVQMGRITGFGLMELSRQRLHSSFIETSYTTCPHCKGKGVMRSTESVSIHTLHVLEEESVKRRFSELHMTVPPATALYVLNNKREDLYKIEQTYHIKIQIEADENLVYPTDYRIERIVRVDDIPAKTENENVSEPEEEENVQQQQETPEEKNSRRERRRNRRHRRDRHRDRNNHHNGEHTAENAEEPDSWVVQEETIEIDDASESGVIRADEEFEAGLKKSDRRKDKKDTEENKQENASLEQPQDTETSEAQNGDNGNGYNGNRGKRRPRFLRRDRRYNKNRNENNNGSEEHKAETVVEKKEEKIQPPPVEKVKAEKAKPESSEKEETPKPRKRRYTRKKATTAETAAE